MKITLLKKVSKVLKKKKKNDNFMAPFYGWG